MLGNKPPYTTMQQLNLDWILSKLKTLLRLVPDDGAVGQILRRTRDGAVWSDEQGGGGGGAVESVNGQTGAVVLDAADVGALPDDYTPPVTRVNGQTGAVVLDADDVGALPDDYTPPVTSVNGQTGAVVIPTGGAVDSVNGQTGAVVLDADDVGALADTLSHIVETGESNGWSYYLLDDNTVTATRAISTTLSNYTTFAGFSGYYIPNIATPFTMENNYYVGLDWSIGAGFGLPAGRLAVTSTGFNAYALSTASGSVSVVLRMTLIGKKAV